MKAALDSSERRPHLDAKWSRWNAFALVLILASFASALAFLELPGRTTQHARVAPDEPYAAPTQDGFRVGILRWDLKRYLGDANLDPFRRFFVERCPGLRGLAAARCISDEFARAFPHGAPKTEFFEAVYDPAVDLREHLAGARGHCVTRSGLVATTLLANGIPARQLEIVAADLQGHNVVEVFDSRWALFDPTFGTVFETPAGPGNAREALLTDTPGKWSKLGEPAKAAVAAEFDIQDIIYPDPWLHTRSGQRAATWPLRIYMVHAGTPIWRYGPAQEMLRRLAFALALASASCLLMPRFLRWRRGSQVVMEPIGVTRATTDPHPGGPPGLEPRT